MAESLGMPLRTWEDWEAGRRSMPDYNLRMLTFYVMSTFKKVNNSHTVNIVHDENGNAIVIINGIVLRRGLLCLYIRRREYLKDTIYTGQKCQYDMLLMINYICMIW